MTKLVKPTPTATTFFLPARDVLAVWNAVSNEKTRYYLHGVFVEQTDAGDINIVATDGTILLKKNVDDDAFVGKDVPTQTHGYPGFLLMLDPTDKALKAHAVGEAWLYGDTDTGIVQVLDVRGDVGEGYRRLGVVEFEQIDGTFPDYRRVQPACTPGEATAPVSVDLAALARFQKAANQYGRGEAKVRITATTPNGPMLVEFMPACEGLQGVIMPVSWR